MQLSKHIYTIFSFIFVIFVLGFAFFSDKISVSSNSDVKSNQAAEKLYIALEEDGAVAVVDTKDNTLLGKIDLTQKKNDIEIRYAAHNVQVAPDGKTVWVTANFTRLGGHEENNQSQDNEKKEFSDQIIVIDPKNESIIKRIDVGLDQHLAHVVISKDGKKVYASAQEPGKIYQINGLSYQIENTISLEKDAQPHGLRLSLDDNSAFIALIGGKGLGVINTKSKSYEKAPLTGSIVQTAVIPNTPYIAASVYDTKQVAFYNTDTKEVLYIQLPDGAEGAIQLYPTPDGKYLYVADQGYYFDKPTSDYVYKIDVQTQQVVSTIQVGVAPHGVVVSTDGKKVYITNLLSDDISVIDSTTDKQIAKIKVGKMPNGISLWSHQSGGTP